jgi:hypothetical protein
VLKDETNGEVAGGTFSQPRPTHIVKAPDQVQEVVIGGDQLVQKLRWRRPAHRGNQLVRRHYGIEILQVAGWPAGKSFSDRQSPEGIEGGEMCDHVSHIPPFAPGGRCPLVIVERGQKGFSAAALAGCWGELTVGGSFDGDDRRITVPGRERHGAKITTGSGGRILTNEFRHSGD